MVRRKLTIPERWQAVGMHNGGFSHRRVADHFSKKWLSSDQWTCLHVRIVHPKWSCDQSNRAWWWRNVNCGRGKLLACISGVLAIEGWQTTSALTIPSLYDWCSVFVKRGMLLIIHVQVDLAKRRVRVLMWPPNAKLPRSAPAVLNGCCRTRLDMSRSSLCVVLRGLPAHGQPHFGHNCFWGWGCNCPGLYFLWL
jgi:hypothetical protein